MPDFETPPPLSRGDRVAVVASSSGAAERFPHVRDLGLDRLRDVFDLRPELYPTAERDDAYLRDHPEARARDLEDAFRDPEVAGVVAAIGGDDQVRLLDHLDLDALAGSPTRFYGYSDNSVLALALWTRGVVTWQGPMLLTELAMQGEMHPDTVAHAERAFFGERMGRVEPADEFTDQDLPWEDPALLDERREFEANPGWRWHVDEADGDRADAPDAVTGRVWGGCLATVGMYLATGKHLPDPADLDGAVLFLETSELLRGPAFVREVLVSMGERGYLERFDAVLVGRVKARNHREDPGPEGREAHREAVRGAFADVLERYNPDAPVVFGFDAGHTSPIVPVPIGGRVTVDPDAERVAFPGP